LYYCEESSEIAFEIIRHIFSDAQQTKDIEQRKTALKEIDATIWMKNDQSINIESYFNQTCFRKYRQYNKDLRQTHILSARIFENYVIAKIDPTNTLLAPLSEFKKMQLRKTRNQNQVFVSPRGTIALPKNFRTSELNRVNIAFDEMQRKITLTLNPNGIRAIKPDHTLSIESVLKSFGVKIEHNMYLPFKREGCTLSFVLKESKTEETALRDCFNLLGITD